MYSNFHFIHIDFLTDHEKSDLKKKVSKFISSKCEKVSVRALKQSEAMILKSCQPRSFIFSMKTLFGIQKKRKKLKKIKKF